MLIAQITDTHLKLPGKLAYRRVDTAQMLRACVGALLALDPQPDLIVHTGDLTDFGHAGGIRAPQGDPGAAGGADPGVPGNHDEREAMRQAFAAEGYLPSQRLPALRRGARSPALHRPRYARSRPGRRRAVRGAACAGSTTTLGQKPDMPTLVLMHHPPFLTGIAHMDRLGLAGREGFAAVMRRHDQVKAILCGHVHRPTFTHASAAARP